MTCCPQSHSSKLKNGLWPHKFSDLCFSVAHYLFKALIVTSPRIIINNRIQNVQATSEINQHPNYISSIFKSSKQTQCRCLRREYLLTQHNTTLVMWRWWVKDNFGFPCFVKCLQKTGENSHQEWGKLGTHYCKSTSPQWRSIPTSFSWRDHNSIAIGFRSPKQNDATNARFLGLSIMSSAYPVSLALEPCSWTSSIQSSHWSSPPSQCDAGSLLFSCCC